MFIHDVRRLTNRNDITVFRRRRSLKKDLELPKLIVRDAAARGLRSTCVYSFDNDEFHDMTPDAPGSMPRPCILSARRIYEYFATKEGFTVNVVSFSQLSGSDAHVCGGKIIWHLIVHW